MSRHVSLSFSKWSVLFRANDMSRVRKNNFIVSFIPKRLKKDFIQSYCEIELKEVTTSQLGLQWNILIGM